MSQRTTKPTMRLVRQAKTQRRLRSDCRFFADRLLQPPGPQKEREPLSFWVDVQAIPLVTQVLL